VYKGEVLGVGLALKLLVRVGVTEMLGVFVWVEESLGELDAVRVTLGVRVWVGDGVTLGTAQNTGSEPGDRVVPDHCTPSSSFGVDDTRAKVPAMARKGHAVVEPLTWNRVGSESDTPMVTSHGGDSADMVTVEGKLRKVPPQTY
jgi:hypothetical protein